MCTIIHSSKFYLFRKIDEECRFDTWKRRIEEDERLLSIIKPIFEYHKSRYGYRRIILALKDKFLSCK